MMTQLILAQGGMDLVVFIILWFGVMYFLLIRPQRLKAKKHQELIKQAKAGDKVITQGGIHGTVKEVEQGSFYIEVADKVVIKVVASAIQAINRQEKNK